MLSQIVAHCAIQSMAPYCQSRHHDTPKLEGEGADAHDLRTWRGRMHQENGIVYIPSRAIHDALSDAAKYSMRQIPGQRKATWTKKFESGIAVFADIPIGIRADDVDCIAVYCNADGKRGSGTRVTRRFPIIPSWSAEFDVRILDPIITEDIFTEMLEMAGMYIGVGQNRPQNRGTHGRFRVVSVKWAGHPLPDLRHNLKAA